METFLIGLVAIITFILISWTVGHFSFNDFSNNEKLGVGAITIILCVFLCIVIYSIGLAIQYSFM
jgi:hypothetical protein